VNYQIYIPGVSGANPNHLVSVGLGELLAENDRGPESVQVDRGPDGKAGMCFAWRKDGGPIGMASNYSWSPATVDKELNYGAGRYYIGLDTDDPPQPAELARDRLIHGHKITLADGHTWIVPSLSTFPSSFALDEEGEIVRETKPAYQKFVDIGAKVVAEMFVGVNAAVELHGAGQSLDEYKIEVTVKEGLRLIAAAIAVNYRLTFDLCMRLKMFDDRSAAVAMVTFCDLADIAEVVNQKKTLAPVTIDAGSIFSNGRAA